MNKKNIYFTLAFIGIVNVFLLMAYPIWLLVDVIVLCFLIKKHDALV